MKFPVAAKNPVACGGTCAVRSVAFHGRHGGRPSNDRAEAIFRFRQRVENAFSLVEVAVSIGVVSFVLLALLGLLSVGLGAEKSSHEDTVVSGLCLATLAELKALPYAGIPATTTTYFTYEGSRTNNSAGAYYQCTTAISDSQWPRSNGFSKRVRIEIAWPTAATNRQASLFETHLAAY